MSGDISDEIVGAVTSVTKKWATQRKKEERHRLAYSRRRDAMTRPREETIKEVAYDVMERAYNKASSNGRLPAHARQIMYAARAEIEVRTGKKLNDQYFTQTLLPDYMAERGVGWNVVYDARGHFKEPHTDKEVPLGTLHVNKY
jgi:ribosomal protein S7